MDILLFIESLAHTMRLMKCDFIRDFCTYRRGQDHTQNSIQCTTDVCTVYIKVNPLLTSLVQSLLLSLNFIDKPSSI